MGSPASAFARPRPDFAFGKDENVILHVWFKPHTVRPEDSAGGRFHVVDVAFDSFEAVCAALNEGGLIQADSIHSRFSGENVRTIHRRERFAFNGASVDRVQPSPWIFQDGDL